MRPIFLVLLGFVTLGCGRTEPSKQPAASQGAPVAVASGASNASAAAGCPMLMAGATATVTDLDRGVAVTYTASPEGVAALRDHVRQMAQMRERMTAGCPCRSMMGDGGAAMQAMMQRMMGDAGMPMQGMAQMQGMGMPPADVRVEDVDGGARVIFTAKDVADVPRLRAHVRLHAEHMRAGGCPMM